VEKYVQQLRKQLVHSGLAKRLFVLELYATHQRWSTSLQDDYDDIQAAHLKLRRQIELKLRKLHMGVFHGPLSFRALETLLNFAQ
jgi:hypothetical protein